MLLLEHFYFSRGGGGRKIQLPRVLRSIAGGDERREGSDVVEKRAGVFGGSWRIGRAAGLRDGNPCDDTGMMILFLYDEKRSIRRHAARRALFLFCFR